MLTGIKSGTQLSYLSMTDHVVGLTTLTELCSIIGNREMSGIYQHTFYRENVKHTFVTPFRVELIIIG